MRRQRPAGPAPRPRRAGRACAARARRYALGQFRRRRALSVSAAPLLDEHGPAIRGAVLNGNSWPVKELASGGLSR
jgi:hypothetical protein